MSRVCVLLTLLTLCAYSQVSSSKSLKLLMAEWSSYKNECSHALLTSPSTPGPVCNRTFDQYACWPDGPLGVTVNVSCPAYLPWYTAVQHGLVYRVCGPDGRWGPKNTSECEQDEHGQQQYGRILQQFRAMYTLGYSLSLGALLLALATLISCRKLHCMRNSIHMNLFSSFILRALSILVKDALLAPPPLTLAPPTSTSADQQVERWVNVQAVAGCRVAMVMMQYSVMANNYWLLVEGLYLHTLLVTTVFTERGHLPIYLAIGWGAPLVFVLPWVTVKYLYENEGCWERNINMGYWWIIRSPILLAYLINFLIFIRIIRILMSKLRAHQMRYTDYKFRLAKSTLTLIPLLGIHAILFTFVIDESVPKGSLMRLIRLFYDLLFNSFQGLLVAILYCFVNKEVQSEVVRRWRRWRLGKDIEEEYRHTHSHTAQAKGGGVGHGNGPDLHDNRCAGSGSTPSPAPAAEENQRLVGSGACHNGTEKSRARGSYGLQRPSLPPGGASSGSSVTEHISLEERAQCYTQPPEEAESNF